MTFYKWYAGADPGFLDRGFKSKTEDHGSCIAHQSVEDMLKSAVNEEKKFKQSDFKHIFS